MAYCESWEEDIASPEGASEAGFHYRIGVTAADGKRISRVTALIEKAESVMSEGACAVCRKDFDRCVGLRGNRGLCRNLLRHIGLLAQKYDCNFCGGCHVQSTCALLQPGAVSRAMKAAGPQARFCCLTCFSPECTGIRDGGCAVLRHGPVRLCSL